MCTLTAFAVHTRAADPTSADDRGSDHRGIRQVLRIAFNRDELRRRAIGLPPEEHLIQGRRCLFPRDPDAGGTWIAANESGVILALLNRNQKPDLIRHPAAIACDVDIYGSSNVSGSFTGAPTKSTSALSRGTIIPRLIQARTAMEALDLAEKLELSSFAPFRLVALDQSGWGTLEWNRRIREEDRQKWNHPILFASSGLGDDLVTDLRSRLFFNDFGFDNPVLSAGSLSGEEIRQWSEKQNAFHRHRWPDRPHLSVNMERPEARTVSHTVIEVDDHEVRMDYYPDGPGATAAMVSVRLPLSPPESDREHR